ncbi:MAG: hypothetical protein V1827_03360 [Candidatus Micrarchaeota archaeon]
MKVLMVEGFHVHVESGDGCVSFTIPELPGIVGQVEKEGEVAREARELIGAYLKEIASGKLHSPKNGAAALKGKDGYPSKRRG